MSDKPLLFSGPMMNALQAGRKTQTRRVMPATDQEVLDRAYNPIHAQGKARGQVYNYAGEELIAKTRFAIGDRLWVREAWRTFVSLDDVPPRDIWSPDQDRGAGIAYEAGGGMSIARGAGRERHYGECDDLDRFGRLRPGMFMPRWASRAFVTVTDVRVQRLQQISEADAIAEGIVPTWPDGMPLIHDGTGGVCREAYFKLWNHLHGPDADFADPWVAAYSFTVTLRNIDEAAT